MGFAISLFANNLYAQKAYVNVNTGYGFSMSSQEIHSLNFVNITSDNYSTTVERVNVSLGKGFYFGGAFGYMFNENIGAELGISYLLGDMFKAKSISISQITDYTLSSKMLRIIPSIVIVSGFEKFNPYAKFGLVIGSSSIIYGLNDNYDGDIWVTKMKYFGGLAFGLSSSIGATFDLNDKISFFGELNMINLSYAPTKGEIIEASFNGVDKLPILIIYEKEIEFVDRVTYNFENYPYPDYSKPRKELKKKFPFGSFGVNVGLRINF